MLYPRRMSDRVIVFGGGVAGLVAAGELADRGFRVTVYEARHWGGKIRSVGKPGSGTDGRKDLPGEHGFHFFPSFYGHVPDAADPARGLVDTCGLSASARRRRIRWILSM